MNYTTGSEYTENIYIYLKLIFAFAAQSSLSKVRNDNVRNAVRTGGTCAVPASVPHTQTSSRNPLFRYRPCRRLAPIMISLYNYVQLHIDDAIPCIINDVMVVLYGMYGIRIVT